MAAGSLAEIYEREFEELLRARRLETVFQPIVDLDTGVAVGYEALVRGPADSVFSTAPAILDQAYRSGRVVEFDWVARASACRSAMAAGLAPDQLLFLNIEPLALGSDCPPDLWPDIEEAFGALHVVLEVTERSLDRDPKSLLEGIDRQRPRAAGLAVDDLGARTNGLSMLPVLAPDVIKLDLTITQAGPSHDALKVLDIAFEEAERTGATILTEGVENDAHAAFASSIGAALGQGRYFGSPGPITPPSDSLGATRKIGSTSIPDIATPFDALQGWSIGRADHQLLTPLSRQVVYREVPVTAPALVLVLVPEPDLLSPDDRAELANMAQRGVVTGALGRGLSPSLPPGVRGAAAIDDQLDGQWAVVTLSPATASAMLARALPGSERRFEFGVTHDRRRVVAAARCLLRRLEPLEPREHLRAQA